MILLDSDHATHLKFPASRQGAALIARLNAVRDIERLGMPIITVEEQMRGWLAVVARERQFPRQVFGYRELQRLLDFCLAFEIVPFDAAAATRAEELRGLRIRIGAMDLKIAATALVQNALLLTANRRDFEQVPGLRSENWLEP